MGLVWLSPYYSFHDLITSTVRQSRVGWGYLREWAPMLFPPFSPVVFCGIGSFYVEGVQYSSSPRGLLAVLAPCLTMAILVRSRTGLRSL